MQEFFKRQQLLDISLRVKKSDKQLLKKKNGAKSRCTIVLPFLADKALIVHTSTRSCFVALYEFMLLAEFIHTKEKQQHVQQ